MPPELHGCALLQTGPLDGLLRSAVWVGLSVKLPELKAIVTSLKLPALKAGNGSGAKGRIVMCDYARQLVEHLYPNASQADKTRMTNAIALPPKPRKQTATDTGLDEEMSLEVMASQLDADNAEEFRDLVKECKDRLLEKSNEVEAEKMREKCEAKAQEELNKALEKFNQGKKSGDASAAPPAAAASGAAGSGDHTGAREKKTPKEFNSLFHFPMTGLSCKHDQAKQTFAFVFPCDWTGIYGFGFNFAF